MKVKKRENRAHNFWVVNAEEAPGRPGRRGRPGKRILDKSAFWAKRSGDGKDVRTFLRACPPKSYSPAAPEAC